VRVRESKRERVRESKRERVRVRESKRERARYFFFFDFLTQSFLKPLVPNGCVLGIERLI
jgi:hypothetical protein